MAHVTLTDQNFEEEVINSDKPVLVDFWAAWCGPCRMLAPVIDEVAEELGDDVKVGKLNVDENPEMAAKYKIMSIPSVKLFKDGEVVEDLVGLRPKDAYIQAAKQYLED